MTFILDLLCYYVWVHVYIISYDFLFSLLCAGSSQLYEGDDFIDEDRKARQSNDDNSSVGSTNTGNTGGAANGGGECICSIA